MRIGEVCIRFNLDKKNIGVPKPLQEHEQFAQFTKALLPFVTSHTEALRRMGVYVVINDQDGNNITIPASALMARAIREGPEG